MHPSRLISMAVRHGASAILLGLATLTPVACSAEGTVADTQSRSNAATPVAEVNGTPISMGELEMMLASELGQLEQQRRWLLENGVQELVNRKLLEAEAKTRNINVDELLKIEIEDKATAVSDQEAEAFYQMNRARINRPKTQVMPQIKVVLAKQKQARLRDELLTSLRTKFEARVLLEPVRAEIPDDTAPSKGPADSPVTIVEFSDFQCPYCRHVVPALQQVLKTYPQQVRLVYRQFPLDFHSNAQKAAEASLCAQDQGKFWEMHDAMFANQQALAPDQLKAKAAEITLNTAQFNKCLDSDKYAAKVRQDRALGTAVGVNGTPALFVNGRLLSGAVPFDEIQELIEDELARKGKAGEVG